MSDEKHIPLVIYHARSKASGWVKPMTIGGTATQPDRLRSPRTGL